MDNREEERGEGRGIIVALHAKQEDGKDFHFSANVYRKQRCVAAKKKHTNNTRKETEIRDIQEKRKNHFNEPF